jgi:hypothetical protein
MDDALLNSLKLVNQEQKKIDIIHNNNSEKNEELNQKDNKTMNTNNNNTTELEKDETNQKEIQNKTNSQQLKYGYKIFFTNPNEDGLIESFLNDPSGENKQHNDTSDYFNYGLDEEKWRKIINYSILMHYKKHLKDEKRKMEEMKNENQQNNSYQYPTDNNNGMNNRNFMPFNPMLSMYYHPLQMRNKFMYNNVNMMNNPILNNMNMQFIQNKKE